MHFDFLWGMRKCGLRFYRLLTFTYYMYSKCVCGILNYATSALLRTRTVRAYTKLNKIWSKRCVQFRILYNGSNENNFFIRLGSFLWLMQPHWTKKCFSYINGMSLYLYGSILFHLPAVPNVVKLPVPLLDSTRIYKRNCWLSFLRIDTVTSDRITK